jgi:predicted site-specific integrase-resolvase
LRVDHYTLRKWIHLGILEADVIRQGKRVRYRIKRQVIEAIERRDPERHRVLV